MRPLTFGAARDARRAAGRARSRATGDARPVERPPRADYIHRVIGARPPFALATPQFLCPALAQLAGRAPLGGGREVVLACFVGTRLAATLLPEHALPAATRLARAGATRTWLATLSLPAALRIPCARLVDASAGDDAEVLAAALERVTSLAAEQLDQPARAEMESLARAIRGMRARDEG